MAITTRQIADRVLTKLREVPGADTQTYADAVLLETIQHTFDRLFDKYWWNEYFVADGSGTLDGTTGYPSAEVTGLTRFTDIKYVWLGNGGSIPAASGMTNPNSVRSPVIVPVPIAFTSGHIFKIIPATTSGDFRIAYRRRPANFTALNSATENTIYLDDQMMILGTAWDFVDGTGVNAMEAEKLKQQYLERVDTVLKNMQGMDIASNDDTSMSNYVGGSWVYNDAAGEYTG